MSILLEKIIAIWFLLIGTVILPASICCAIYIPVLLIKIAIKDKKFPSVIEVFVIFVSVTLLPTGAAVIAFLMLFVYQNVLF